MSHFRTSMKGKMGVILSTICIYNRYMFGKTSSLSSLMYGSLCASYSRYSSWLIVLKRSPQCGSTILDPGFTSITPKVVGWMKTFFVVVLTIGSSLGAYSNFLMVSREETSPVSGSFRFGAHGKCLMVGFLGGIVPAT
jgi:hypothetical protein